MNDLISRQAAIEALYQWMKKPSNNEEWQELLGVIQDVPPAQPEDWMGRNKERILQAGMEGREIEFRIGGRLFAIREKAQ